MRYRVRIPSRQTGAAGWRHPVRLLSCALALLMATPLLLDACGTSGKPPSGSQNARPGGASYEITVGRVANLGTVLVDGSGMTLYLFMPDNRSSHSTCYGVCAVQWPPVILPQGATAAIAGPGIDPALLSVAPRKGQTAGGLQVNYNGWSLYTWPGDTAPGQATGQGLNNLGGLWYVVSPRGNPVR